MLAQKYKAIRTICVWLKTWFKKKVNMAGFLEELEKNTLGMREREFRLEELAKNHKEVH